MAANAPTKDSLGKKVEHLVDREVAAREVNILQKLSLSKCISTSRKMTGEMEMVLVK